MYLLLAAVVSGTGWFLFRRWRNRQAADQRLSAAFWRNSLVVLLAYLLYLLAGGFLTRLMAGFNTSGLANLLLVGFYLVWIAYGALWLLRFLPHTGRKPAWIDGSRFWLDVLGIAVLLGFAVVARLV
ncbi:hypothetical protein VW29_20825 [Devosia limi DSM 17137]|uniref:Uncharacterized protein n=1 Tax=Devosia limi DSM 17137 TaxID=1121477 RepID=A0A0F5L3K4_9HYPH|nr:hypothetical protein [Devosia limi]KKB76192.1 hypothetical protein VW29_20825 [Devosia limi DSM 17137]SHF19702.1 hypothetical protein SAMN02745223_02022 [Devosia limi DSM 17137]